MSFNFGSDVFGDFTSTSITEPVNIGPPNGRVGFSVLGDWTPGTFSGFSGLTGESFPAEVTVSLNQTGGEGEAISGSFTFATTTESPSAIPLPAALPLFATGIGGLGLLGWRRKRKARAAA